MKTIRKWLANKAKEAEDSMITAPPTWRDYVVGSAAVLVALLFAAGFVVLVAMLLSMLHGRV